MTAVTFENIVKAFGPVQVLHGVSFEIAPGRVIGLLGENGAGKSTLMKILAGYEGASGGALRVDGEAVSFDGPRAAEARGIVMIHQEFALAEDLTIAQNIFLGHEKTRGLMGFLRAAHSGTRPSGGRAGAWLDDAAMRAETVRVLRQVGLNASPDTLPRSSWSRLRRRCSARRGCWSWTSRPRR
jgi:ribose transport system ATP-binding protein